MTLELIFEVMGAYDVSAYFFQHALKILKMWKRWCAEVKWAWAALCVRERSVEETLFSQGSESREP